MKISRTAISINVPNVPQSAEFASRHFGFEEEMAAEGFSSMSRDGVGFNLIFLETGLETFKPPRIAGSAREGLLVVFVVDQIDAEYERLLSEGVNIVTPIETEPWGERYFQVEDPNGIIYQLVQWMSDG